ncbi:MAG: serine O-acetyltransferase, partial [Pseudomonadota bacterium]|nr:serine O-acetyltransferase [Pseudomonadota bacterium]
AVVVKDVAEGETVVGVPGRIVRAKSQMTEDERQQQKLAQSVGFDAYGTSSKSQDPVATAIHGLIEHIQAMDKRVESLRETIHRLGGELPEDVDMPELDNCDISKENDDSKVD